MNVKPPQVLQQPECLHTQHDAFQDLNLLLDLNLWMEVEQSTNPVTLLASLHNITREQSVCIVYL